MPQAVAWLASRDCTARPAVFAAASSGSAAVTPVTAVIRTPGVALRVARTRSPITGNA